MDPVWFVRSRQVAARFRFWLALFGYDPRDRSLSHRIYLVYATIFFILWGFAVLALVAGGAGQVLVLTAPLFSRLAGGQEGALPAAALGLGALGLAVWALVAAYAASRRCPLRFSEDDAHLICQTPVSRPRVALAWLTGQWVESAPLAGAAAVTLGFGLVEAGSPQGLSAEDLPRYLLAGARSLAVFLPLHLGLTALAWSLGVLRLQADRRRPWLVAIPLGLAALLLILLLPAGVSALAGASLPGGPSWLSASPAWLLWPVAFPLRSAFGLQPWAVGQVFALAEAGIALLILRRASVRLNLSRAALESRGLVQRENALLSGSTSEVEEIDKRERLGFDRRPSAWLASRRWDSASQRSSGVLALLLKDRVQAARTRRFRDLFTWLGLFSVGLAVFTLADWGLRAFSLLMWIILVQGQTTRRLQADLRLWTLLRQLPLSGRRIVLAEAAYPLLLVCLLAWAAILVSALLAGLFALQPASAASLWALIFLIPALALDVALGGALDVLRQSKSATLLSGQAPLPGLLAAALGGALAGRSSYRSVWGRLGLSWRSSCWRAAPTCWPRPATGG
jgi:hypothetical protein